MPLETVRIFVSAKSPLRILLLCYTVCHCVAVFKEIEAATGKVIEAVNNGTLDPVDYYTEDCQVIRPGHQAVTSHRGIELSDN